MKQCICIHIQYAPYNALCIAYCIFYIAQYLYIVFYVDVFVLRIIRNDYTLCVIHYTLAIIHYDVVNRHTCSCR